MSLPVHQVGRHIVNESTNLPTKESGKRMYQDKANISNEVEWSYYIIPSKGQSSNDCCPAASPPSFVPASPLEANASAGLVKQLDSPGHTPAKRRQPGSQGHYAHTLPKTLQALVKRHAEPCAFAA
jgi:hypothetical protein